MEYLTYQKTTRSKKKIISKFVCFIINCVFSTEKYVYTFIRTKKKNNIKLETPEEVQYSEKKNYFWFQF